MINHHLPKQNIVYLHRDLQKTLNQEYAKYKSKVHWVIRNFILDGTTSNIKIIKHHSLKWRRTPIDGNSLYLWWISSRESGTQDIRKNLDEQVWEFYLRLIRPHDENPVELDLGSRADYPTAESIMDLEPCKEEQTQVIEHIHHVKHYSFSMDSIRGNPGSGKTVTLEYAAFKLSFYYDQQIQYITYTSGLKNRAEKFFAAHDISKNVQSITFDEFLGSSNYRTDYNFKKFNDFLAEYIKSPEGLQQLGKNKLGLWTGNEKILWIELRAYIYGISLPFDWQRGDIHIDGSQGLIHKDQYCQLRKQETTIEQRELDIAYTIATALYDNHNKYKKIFPDLYYARQTLENFIANRDSTINHSFYDSIIIDEIQDLTLLQIALIFEKGKTFKNPHNNLAFRFIIAGDESQTLLPSGFKWDFTNNLFTSKFYNCATTPQEHPFKSNYRNPKLIAELVESTYKLYSTYTNKQLTPESSFKTNNLHEIQDSGKIILWKMLDSTGYALPNPQLLAEDIDSYISEVVVVDLSEKRLEKYQKYRHKLPFYYSDKEIKGLERQVVIVVGLSKKIRELRENHQKNNYISLLKNRNIIDSIRVVFSRSTKLLIIADYDTLSIQEEFPSLQEKEYPWQVIAHAIQDVIQAQELSLEEEVLSLINVTNQTIDEGDIKRAKQYLQKALKTSEKIEDKNSIEKLISDLEIKIFDAELSVVKREILCDNHAAAKHFYHLSKDADSKNINIRSLSSFLDIQSYLNWHHTLDFIDICKRQSIASISKKEIEQSLDSLNQISDENYFIKEGKLKPIEIKEKHRQIIFIQKLHLINGIEDRIDIANFYKDINITDDFLREIFPNNNEVFKKIENSIWYSAKSVREENPHNFYRQSLSIGKYIEELERLLDIFQIRSPQSSFIFEFLIDIYRKYYPLTEIEKIQELIIYINDHNFMDRIEESQFKHHAYWVRAISFDYWVQDILNFLCSEEVDLDHLLDILDLKAFASFARKARSLNITKEQNYLLKQKFPPSFLQEMSRIFQELDIPEILIEVEKSLNRLEALIKTDSFQSINDNETKYIQSKIKSISDFCE